jgi:hypothetical protein
MNHNIFQPQRRKAVFLKSVTKRTAWLKNRFTNKLMSCFVLNLPYFLFFRIIVSELHEKNYFCG